MRPDIARRPLCGLRLPCRVVSVSAANHLLLHLPGIHEVELFLLDCDAPPAFVPSESEGVAGRINSRAISARDCACKMTAEAGRSAQVFVPQPNADRGWSKQISAATKHAGFLILRDGRTLNDALVEAGVCERPSVRYRLRPAA